ncbi:hypothetical protein QCA50_017786 [Cerrena zonata]|uniref:Uncharacterized protein n=1 Tax=Cerrena zonata TaxID=2478898 RepID=A0AAW0FCG2_9APHY
MHITTTIGIPPPPPRGKVIRVTMWTPSSLRKIVRVYDGGTNRGPCRGITITHTQVFSPDETTLTNDAGNDDECPELEQVPSNEDNFYDDRDDFELDDTNISSSPTSESGDSHYQQVAGDGAIDSMRPELTVRLPVVFSYLMSLNDQLQMLVFYTVELYQAQLEAERRLRLLRILSRTDENYSTIEWQGRGHLYSHVTLATSLRMVQLYQEAYLHQLRSQAESQAGVYTDDQ